MLRRRSTLLAFAGLLAMNAQDAPPADSFDTAIAKPYTGAANPAGYSHQITPQGLTMRGVSMGYCIRLAYGLSAQRPYELAGPAWLDPPTDSVFEIAGKCDRPASPERIKLMLQALLKERFRLAVHRERRDLPAYLLTVSKAGLMQPSAVGETKIAPGVKPNQLVFRHVSMAQLALQLGPPITSRPVADLTGMPGSFDFALDLNRYLTDPETGKVITGTNGRIDQEEAVIRGVHDQLGLTMKPGRAAIDVLVVDHVEKKPVEN